MKVFAISDLHLSFQVDKPMNLFGEHWDNYEQRILDDWNAKVGAEDVGIIAGDISWAMRMSETAKDFDFLSKLNGTKIIVRGNHDYWWSTVSKVRAGLPAGCIALQNDSVRLGNTVFCGTRGWKIAERRQTLKQEDQTILDREIIRFDLSLQDASKKMQDGDKLIAVFHFPPFNSTRDDSAFTQLCEKYNVSAAVYGHLHGKNCRGELVAHKNRVVYYLTSCDLLQYKAVQILSEK